jgi:hypothetical protein
MEFKTELRYENHGSAEFGEPLIRAGGPTVVTTYELGRTVANMEVTDVPTSGSLLARPRGVRVGSLPCSLSAGKSR